jgi:hypothetical protein
MKGVKIKIECDDVLLASAIASSISEGLRLDDFDNVQVKTVMVYNEVVRNAEGRPTNFARTNIVKSVIDEDIMSRPPLHDTILVPADAALGYPICNETLREREPSKLHTPIVIDMGIEVGDYAKQERAFLQGETE